MMTYIPYCLQFFLIYGPDSSPSRNSYAAACYLALHSSLTIVSHTISIWLTVCVALFRYFCVGPPNLHKYCSIKRVKIAVVAVTIGSVAIHVISMLSYNVKRYLDVGSNETWYTLTNDKIRVKSLGMVQYISLAVFVKLGPCVILTVMSALLIHTLLSADARYRLLRQASNNNNTVYKSPTSQAERLRHQQTKQTTKLIVAVLILFIVAELPQGLLFLLTGLLDGFFDKVYHPLGNLLDLLTIVSCCVNFTLYCAMSSKFKTHLTLLFRQCLSCRQETSADTDIPLNTGRFSSAKSVESQ